MSASLSITNKQRIDGGRQLTWINVVASKIDGEVEVLMPSGAVRVRDE